MAKVTLISYTGHGHPDPLYAAKLLAYTKNTRLNMSPEGLDTFMAKSAEEIAQEMAYMATTIPSSWEFADCIFSIEKVSRATAQQITRTRTASFAMQSQRVSDMSQVTWDLNTDGHTISVMGCPVDFDVCMGGAIDNYSRFVDAGMPLEDARDLLPIGVHCNLIAKYNLRGLVELCRARDSLRVQGPYRDVCAQIKAGVLGVWPWAEPFFVPPQAAAVAMIEAVAIELAAMTGAKGAMYSGLAGKLAKAADLVKKW
jgi:thymidylate synthase ThyX